MKISKRDALCWFEFFSSLPEDEPLGIRQTEILYAGIAQLERAVEKRRAPLLQSLNAETFGGRTLFCGDKTKFPRGCASCLAGTGLNAIRKTNRCNLRCPFCYDYGQMDNQPPVGEGLWEIGGTRFYREDLPLLLTLQKAPPGICYVYLEPFLEIDEYMPVIEIFHKKNVYQHMYTNGTLATEENLKKLGDAGLDELRFNLGASNVSDRVIDMMAAAKKYIPFVGVETPMTPEFFRLFHEKKEAVLQTGIDFMNMAELHLNPNNVDNYLGEPMYMTRMGYLSPIWSRDLTLRLMLECEREHWPLCLHDCSNRTKFARDLNLKAKEGGWFGQSAYGREFESISASWFLSALKDEGLPFPEEEEMPKGYRVGDLVL